MNDASRDEARVPPRDSPAAHTPYPRRRENQKTVLQDSIRLARVSHVPFQLPRALHRLHPSVDPDRLERRV